MQHNRILVVDDQEENRYLIEVLLKGNGYEAFSTNNGAEALAQLHSGEFDLIISDILMPVMDGFELCRQVKADERLRRIPFIVYTATYTGPQDEAFAMKIGANQFLQKPCEPELLMATVREVMAAARSGEAAPPPEPPQDEEVFKLYNERLVRKLEQKMLQLEQETKTLRETEKALRISERKYRRLHDSITDGYAYADLQGIIRESNESFRRMLGYADEELSRLTYRDLTPEKWHAYEQEIIAPQVLLRGSSDVFEKEYRHKDGSVFPVELKLFLVRNDVGEKEGVWALVRDITERKQAERTQKELEAQLYQAQKMESVGRLAGGVAHDFNNMLSVILSYAEMAMDKVEQGTPLHRDLTEIHCAGLRSADIVRRLLTFARKEASAPQVLDLNARIADLVTMLGRLIGEHIDLRWQPGGGPLPVCMDPSHLDHILANLCVNARDAISGVGSITITTGTTLLDEAACTRYPDCNPGAYVTLSVRDTGCGMDEATRARLFEPFFTTKETGAGTGLGLATVFGIVRQTGGCIEVDSIPGQGTTVRLYLPADNGSHDLPHPEDSHRQPPGGTETVLIVDDESSILKIAQRMLGALGYTVLSAAGPSEALEVAGSRNGPIHLLLTDVVMPEMSGRDLVPRIQAVQPGIRVLYMSGYSLHIISNLVVLESGLPLISKPFSLLDLAEKIREVLA